MTWVRERPTRDSRALAQAVALAATLAAAAALVAAQPLRAPWFVYADSDAPYVASGLNLVLGTGTTYFDHPGLPLQQLAALTFEVRRFVVGAPETTAYVDSLLLDLDAARPYYRAYGVLLFLAAVAVAFAVGRRLGGGTSIGVAAGLLLLGAPGLAPMSIQFRADAALPLVLLGGALLIAEAARRRDAALFLAAGAVAGFALTVKLSAAPLLVALAVAAAWQRPDDVRLPRLRPAVLAAGVAGWLAVAAILNRPLYPFTLPRSGLVLAAAIVIALAGYAAAARAVRRGPLQPFYAALAAAVSAGVLLPVTWTIPDGLRMLPWIARGLTGTGGVTAEVSPFSGEHLDVLTGFPVLYALPLLAIATGALAAGIRRGDAVLAALAAGSVTASALAVVLLVGREWYFIPPYVLAIPPALIWLRRMRGGTAAIVALMLAVLVPQVLHLRDPARAAEREEQVAAAAARFASERLPAGAVALAPPEYPTPDTRFFELVEVYVPHAPRYPYRFLPATEPAAALASERELRPAYLVGTSGPVRFGGLVYTTGSPEPWGPLRVFRLEPS